MATFKEEILERVLTPKEGSLNDGGLAFDKGRMLCLVFAKDQVYSQSDDSISLSSYLGYIHWFYISTLLGTHCTFCQMYLIENSQFIAEQTVSGIPVITMVLLAGSVGWPGATLASCRTKDNTPT